MTTRGELYEKEQCALPAFFSFVTQPEGPLPALRQITGHTVSSTGQIQDYTTVTTVNDGWASNDLSSVMWIWGCRCFMGCLVADSRNRDFLAPTYTLP